MSDVTRILSQFEQGDPRTRIVGAKGTMNYWDLEAARLALEQGLPCLKNNADTGLLSGVPDRSKKVAVVVITTIDREIRRLDARVLSWENERVLEVVNENVGSATRPFRMTSAR